MSPCKRVNGKKTQLCRYECGTQIWWDESKSLFIEENGGATHTQEMCKSIKDSKPKQEVTLEALQKKLESLGIIVNVEKLMNQ